MRFGLLLVCGAALFLACLYLAFEELQRGGMSGHTGAIDAALKAVAAENQKSFAFLVGAGAVGAGLFAVGAGLAARGDGRSGP